MKKEIRELIWDHIRLSSEIFYLKNIRYIIQVQEQLNNLNKKLCELNDSKDKDFFQFRIQAILDARYITEKELTRLQNNKFKVEIFDNLWVYSENFTQEQINSLEKSNEGLYLHIKEIKSNFPKIKQVV